MRTYTIQKVQGKPDWSTVPIMPIDTLLWTDEIDVSAQAQICWDDEALYLRMEAIEPHIRMEGTDVLSEVCEDSCLEFFFRPTERLNYFNIEMNPNGAVYFGYGCELGVPGLVRLVPEERETLFGQRVTFTSNGWVLTYRIPFYFIKRFFPEFRAGEGVRMYANAYKCGDKTVKPHFLSWNPVLSETPSFHRMQDFGCLIFG